MSAELHAFQPEEVMAYLDGEVKGARALAVAQHLEDCAICSALADDFCALSQQLNAWRVPLAALEEPTPGLGKEGDAQREPEMVCSEFPQGLPPSYKEPAAGLTPRSMLWSPWMWAVAGTGAVVMILLVQFFRTREVPSPLSASAQQLLQQDISSLKDRLAQDEKANTDLQGDLKAVTDKLKITQGQLRKARVEAAKLNDETNQNVTALDTSVHSELATKASSDDVKSVDTKGFGVRTDLDTTREDLKMAKSEMGTLIARNHDEINQLRRLGERDYTEFTITGVNRPLKVANVTVELEGVNEKREWFDLAITVEGRLFPKKNRAINEPIFFYTTGTRIPEEIVINKVTKDSISGYVSVPKVTEKSASGNVSAGVGKMIERTASLSLIVKDLETARTALQEITRKHDGYFAELNTSGQSNTARTLTASVRVPSSQLDSALAEVRKFGELDEEKQGGEEVSRQYVDLKAGLENGHNTEKRLTELLAKRKDRLKDTLDVERELASTREEIERMEGEQRNLQQQVDYASIEVNLREEYKPALNLAPPGAGKQMRNALVDGYRAVTENGLALVLLLFREGPNILFWLLLAFFPIRWGWRKLRLAMAERQSLAGAA
jgi:myosin heavy subunit